LTIVNLVILLANPIQEIAFPVADFTNLFGKNTKVKGNAENIHSPYDPSQDSLGEIANICA